MLSEPQKNINIEKREKIDPHGALRERYAQCVREQGIPQNSVKWYLSWVEQFARASNGFRDVKYQITGVLAELIDKMRAEIRARHYSIRTEKAYVEWVCRYAGFLGARPIQIPFWRRSHSGW